MYFIISKNNKYYFSLALKHKTTPWLVYKLAHGKPTYSVKGKNILKDLKRIGIIDDITLG